MQAGRQVGGAGNDMTVRERPSGENINENQEWRVRAFHTIYRWKVDGRLGRKERAKAQEEQRKEV